MQNKKEVETKLKKPATLPDSTHEKTDVTPEGNMQDEGDDLNFTKDITPPTPPSHEA